MKEKIKKNWKVTIISIFIIILLSTYFLFVLDIGINSKYFVRRDFNNAFLYRKTGNCTVFKGYFLKDVEKWGERCIQEKDKEGNPIKDFSIKDITVEGNTAFLQVELVRDIPELQLEQEKKADYDYVVNYSMEKRSKEKFFFIFPKTKWIIVNEFR
ncbi:hypothetical protein ACFL06_00755 [Patescibacteria group bacterium]